MHKIYRRKCQCHAEEKPQDLLVKNGDWQNSTNLSNTTKLEVFQNDFSLQNTIMHVVQCSQLHHNLNVISVMNSVLIFHYRTRHLWASNVILSRLSHQYTTKHFVMLFQCDITHFLVKLFLPVYYTNMRRRQKQSTKFTAARTTTKQESSIKNFDFQYLVLSRVCAKSKYGKKHIVDQQQSLEKNKQPCQTLQYDPRDKTLGCLNDFCLQHQITVSYYSELLPF